MKYVMFTSQTFISQFLGSGAPQTPTQLNQLSQLNVKKITSDFEPQASTVIYLFVIYLCA